MVTDVEPPGAETSASKPAVGRRLHGARWWVPLLAALAAFITARLIPPLYADGTWWGTFFTSAGFGGSLAVVGAGIASYIAFHNSQSDREQKHEADDLARWWDRFAWACEKAVSTTPGESEMGLSVLKTLIDAPWARDEDNEMAIDVFNAINEAMAHKKRWWQL